MNKFLLLAAAAVVVLPLHAASAASSATSEVASNQDAFRSELTLSPLTQGSYDRNGRGYDVWGHRFER